MHVIIVGGGFGGVKAALELSKDTRNTIELISNRTNFQYYPALYSSASGGTKEQSWIPLEDIFENNDSVRLVADEIVKINPTTKEVTTKSGISYQYDACILALGTVTTYFGIEGLDTYAHGIKSSAEIYRLKQQIYHDVEKGETASRYVVIGAGPTGVELASSLATYLERLYRRYGVKDKKVFVEIVEAAPRVLPRSNAKVSKKVHKRLEKLGITVKVDTKVEAAVESGLEIDNDKIPCETIIWTSGVANHPFFLANQEHFSLAKNGRVEVNDYLGVSDSIYVIGDNAATPFTGLAQTALRDGHFVAENIKNIQNNKLTKKYKPVSPPTVVPVGENWAVMEWKFIVISGYVGSLIRRVADFVGYNDILPMKKAFERWHSSTKTAKEVHFSVSDETN